MTEPARPSEITSLADALRTHGAVRVPLSVIWRLWADSAPRLIGAVTQATELESALRQLSDRELIELPSAAWDTSTTPPLPRSVTVPANRGPKRARGWTTFPWRRELGWAASLSSLSEALFHDLVAINDWLARNSEPPPALPMRYRSAEIFGDEKRLEALTRTGVFATGRLSLELLHAVRRPAPLPAAIVGEGPDLLVMENSDTYWAAIDILKGLTRQPIGAVAWGSGQTFPAQISTLAVDVAGRGPLRGRCWYWGDLDPAGLRIAAAAHAEARIAGITPIVPAAELWAAMGTRPVQKPGTVDWSKEDGRDWLGGELWGRLANVREAKGRVAQEAVPPNAIWAWANSLS